MFASPIASDELQSRNLFVPASLALDSDRPIVSSTGDAIATDLVAMPIKSQIVPASLALDSDKAIVPSVRTGVEIATVLLTSRIESDDGNRFVPAYFLFHQEFVPYVRAGDDVADVAPFESEELQLTISSPLHPFSFIKNMLPLFAVDVILPRGPAIELLVRPAMIFVELFIPFKSINSSRRSFHLEAAARATILLFLPLMMTSRSPV